MARELGPGAVSLPAGGLRVAAAVIARCAAALCMDSGPAHMDAGVGTPVAVVSCHPVGGSDAHPQAPVRFAPQGGPDRVLVLRPPRPLPPCRDGCTRETAHCIALVDMDVAWPLLAPFLRAALERRAG